MAFSFKIGGKRNGSTGSAVKKPLVSKASLFGGDDEDEDESSKSNAEAARARVNAQLAKQTEFSNRQTEAASKAAQEVDANGMIAA